MSFAHNTQISTPDGTVDIFKIAVGDMAMLVNGEGTAARQVQFSQGGGESSNSMFKVSFDGGALFLSSDQPVMLSDMTVKKAGQLMPGHDRLLGANGQTPLLQSLEKGRVSYRFHSIAFSASPSYGSFVIANGIICGDFGTEISFK